MSQDSIVVESLSKRYELGAARSETMLREYLAALFRGRRVERSTIWALKEVSFKIKQGDVVGIIGRNGAGKSTLLKILSRITHPTSGRVRVNGRVASLLEVGTGFHEELTGRENIFLNGSILGMKRAEVERKMDQIVAFSGVERFLETPIKRYSSGMRLRLGFAVAAHLDPDVLIVDEVLAVGDAGFQKKCIGAMEDLQSSGRTVLFVSHNMAAVENLCARGIWIDNGQLRQDGAAHDVIEAYMGAFASADSSTTDLSVNQFRRGSGEIRYSRCEILGSGGEPKSVVRSGDSLTLRLHYRASSSVTLPSFGFRMSTELGTLITETSTWHHGLEIPVVAEGDGYVELSIRGLNLTAGRYSLTLAITGMGNHVFDWIDNGFVLDVEPSSVYGSSITIDSRYGVSYFSQLWNLDGITVPPTVG
jgi:lipopolysaccharide transport system ATP-binding protein